MSGEEPSQTPEEMRTMTAQEILNDFENKIRDFFSQYDYLVKEIEADFKRLKNNTTLISNESIIKHNGLIQKLVALNGKINDHWNSMEGNYSNVAGNVGTGIESLKSLAIEVNNRHDIDKLSANTAELQLAMLD